MKTPAPLATGEWLIGPDAHFVYEVYDCLDRLLYIGITNDLASRFSKHRQDSHWYISAARVVWTQYATRYQASSTEERLIRERTPECNVVHNDGRYIALSMGHRRLYPSSAWAHLGKVIREERDRRGRPLRSVAGDGKLDINVLREMEAGETTRYTFEQIEQLQYGMGWQTGSVEAVLQGDSPIELTPELRIFRAHVEYDRLDVMGGV